MVLPEQENSFFKLNFTKGLTWEKKIVDKDSYKFSKVDHHLEVEDI